jgi:hypothetical protein
VHFNCELLANPLVSRATTARCDFEEQLAIVVSQSDQNEPRESAVFLVFYKTGQTHTAPRHLLCPTARDKLGRREGFVIPHFVWPDLHWPHVGSIELNAVPLRERVDQFGVMRDQEAL